LKGTSWTPIQLTPPGGETPFGSVLDTVTCPSASSCIAAGDAGTPAGDLPFVAVKSGKTWTVSSLALPPGVTTASEETPVGIACSGGNCLLAASATGLVALLGGAPSVLFWDHGGKWSAHESPPTTGSKAKGTFLSGVACSGATFCVAAGAAGHVTSPKPYVVIGAGSSWKAPKVPLPSGLHFELSALSSVSCLSGDRCDALGEGEGITGLDGLIVSLDHSKVETVTAAEPSGGLANASEAEGISCASKSCLGVGAYVTIKHHLEPDLLSGSGTSFSVAKAPVPKRSGRLVPGALLYDSCASAGYCSAVGAMTSGSGNYLLSGSGLSWEDTYAPLPRDGRGESYVDLTNVSCPGADSCAASGIYLTKSGLIGSVVEMQR
jgi:hypothetical protein